MPFEPTDANRAIVFTPARDVADWIDAELADQFLEVKTAYTVRDVVEALVDDPPPRAQILIADFDQMSASDVLHLHAVRERGWFGCIVAVGTVSEELRKSLNIDRVLRAGVRGVLRKAVTGIGLDKATTRIDKLEP